MTGENVPEKKSLEYYMGLSYPIEVIESEEGGYVVSIPALPGCITQVEKFEDAHKAIKELCREWLKAAFEDGAEIPLPKKEKEYSGKFVLRLPKSVHRRLDERAEEEGVSLNTLLVTMLSEGLVGKQKQGTAPYKDYQREEDWKVIYREKYPNLSERERSKAKTEESYYIGGIEEYASINAYSGRNN